MAKRKSKAQQLKEIQESNRKLKSLILQSCREENHEVDYFYKNGKQIMFCFQCNDFRKYGGQVYFGQMKRFLENNRN